MSRFPEKLGPVVDAHEVDLDEEDVRFRGEPLTEARAEKVAQEILSRLPGRPSLSGPGQLSPSLTVRLPADTRARLDEVASKEGLRPSEVLRNALDDYLEKYAG